MLDDALAERGVPCRRGEVLLAIDGEHAATVVEVIGMLGLDCQIVRNRTAVMVLPAGVTKGTGLGAVLTEMTLSPHNTIAVGDAENDLSLFGVAEIGAAVASAVASVREHADLVLEKEDGAGVADLLAGPYLSGARRWCPPRWWVEIGTFDDGTPVKVPGSQARMLVTGPAGSGRITWSDSWPSNGSRLATVCCSLTPKATTWNYRSSTRCRSLMPDTSCPSQPNWWTRCIHRPASCWICLGSPAHTRSTTCINCGRRRACTAKHTDSPTG